MCKFISISPQYITPLNHLYKRYIDYLEDDYNEDTLTGIICKTNPFFWVILSDTNSFAGFVYLDNIIGSSKGLHSAEITTCFHPKFWGEFTKKCAKEFLQLCFDQFKFTKIKALVYPQNFRVKTLLSSCGFKKEATLKSETLRRGINQDIEIYSLFNEKEKLK